MPSNYEGFPVNDADEFGVITSAPPGREVTVRADGEVADSADSPLVTNGDGEIDPGTLSDIDAGTLVHFSCTEGGVSRSISQYTT